MQRQSMLAAAIVLCFAGTAVAQTPGFAPGPQNDPNACKELWKGIGLPEYSRDNDRDTTIVCHTRYVLSHSNEDKIPDWVLERLTREQIGGDNKRPKVKFKAEQFVPNKAVDDDYRNSKFDRGHQAPSDDFKANIDWMVESFILSNIVPQIGVGFNQGIWKELEDHIRQIAAARGELYVVTGPVYPGETGDGKLTISDGINRCHQTIVLDPPKRKTICGASTKCENGVTVPSALFKIVYDPGMKRANAFILPNINHRDSKDFTDAVAYLKQYQVTVQVVEKFTGLEFFRDLPARKRRPIMEQCTAIFGH